ncbi:MAG: hypothetical protein R3349_07945, partial [Geminicoccaceae bacterium]|nr:hypothetical protein [Geminicoccaceae bacterium]
VERGVDLLFMAALEGHPSARASLGRAYLKVKGLEGVSGYEASAWLERMMKVEPDIALKTLQQLLKGLPTEASPSFEPDTVADNRQRA